VDAPPLAEFVDDLDLAQRVDLCRRQLRRARHRKQQRRQSGNGQAATWFSGA
jgi:hypothetical protein